MRRRLEKFRDQTGRPGPANWQLGTYPDGTDDMPVGGISWYEAMAYAEFAGKSLPTVYEWFEAAGIVGPQSGILTLSNFRGRGPPRSVRIGEWLPTGRTTWPAT